MTPEVIIYAFRTYTKLAPSTRINTSAVVLTQPIAVVYIREVEAVTTPGEVAV